MTSFFLGFILYLIEFSCSVNESAETIPETSASPNQQLASMERELRFDVIGPAVNRIQDALGEIIC
ncbi:hypothetical protein AWI76_14620 [Listeria monocytogenes]|nr:hypothetical protein AWI76_14620 [Listeria monocytogenes]